MNDKKSKGKFLFILGICILIISTLFSIIFYTISTSSIGGKFLMGFMALLMQIVTYTFPSLGITLIFIYKSQNKGIRFFSILIGIILCLLWIPLTFFSIVASSGFAYIEKEILNKNAYTNSSEYQTAQENKKINLTEYNLDIESLKEKESNLSKLQDNRNIEFENIEKKYNKMYSDLINNDSQINKLYKDIESYKVKNEWKNGVYPSENKIKELKNSYNKERDSKILEEKKSYDNQINNLTISISEIKKDKNNAKSKIEEYSNISNNTKKNEAIEYSYDGYYKSIFSKDLASKLSSNTIFVLSTMFELAPSLLILISIVFFEFNPVELVNIKKVNLSKIAKTAEKILKQNQEGKPQLRMKMDESKTFAIKVLNYMKEFNTKYKKIPSINNIAKHFNVKENNIKSARDLLKKDGLIIVEKMGNSRNCKTIIV